MFGPAEIIQELKGAPVQERADERSRTSQQLGEDLLVLGDVPP
jgi:hypothetical protein